MKNEDDELDRQWQRALRPLAGDHTPPPQLEHEIVAALRRRDAIVSAQRIRVPRWAYPAAAATLALVLALGFLAGRWTARSPATPGERYLLLLVGDPSFGDRDMERRFYDEYSSWGGRLAAAGRLLNAARLDDARPSLSWEGGAVALAHEAPGAGVSGFFLIRAQDEQEALALARDCPHLKYGGRVEVRRLAGRP
jgi:hypothetical protein